MLASFKFRGLMAPVFTPFHYDEDKSLNLDIIPEYAKYLKKNGIEGVLVNGTTGEGVSQTVTEREVNAEAWMKAAKVTGQTVMIQVGGTNLKDVCRLASHAEKIGASSILCLADLFHQPKTADDLLSYLAVVGKSAPKTPLLYYHIPGFTGIDINCREMLDGAARVPTLVGLKFTCNDLSAGASCIAAGEGKFAVFLGSDTILAAAITLGFDSAIGTTLNMYPETNINILNALKSNNVNEARKQQRKLTTFVGAVAKHGSWVGTFKSAMNLTTPIDVGPVREPLRDLSEQQLKQVTHDLTNLKLL